MCPNRFCESFGQVWYLLFLGRLWYVMGRQGWTIFSEMADSNNIFEVIPLSLRTIFLDLHQNDKQKRSQTTIKTNVT